MFVIFQVMNRSSLSPISATRSLERSIHGHNINLSSYNEQRTLSPLTANEGTNERMNETKFISSCSDKQDLVSLHLGRILCLPDTRLSNHFVLRKQKSKRSIHQALDSPQIQMISAASLTRVIGCFCSHWPFPSAPESIAGDGDGREAGPTTGEHKGARTGSSPRAQGDSGRLRAYSGRAQGGSGRLRACSWWLRLAQVLPWSRDPTIPLWE